MSDSNNQNGPSGSANEDLSRVREILFGAEQRRTTDEIAALRQDFETRLANLRSEVDREREELRGDLEKQLELLRDGKLDRDALAEMFGGMVARLGTAVATEASNGVRK